MFECGVLFNESLCIIVSHEAPSNPSLVACIYKLYDDRPT